MKILLKKIIQTQLFSQLRMRYHCVKDSSIFKYDRQRFRKYAITNSDSYIKLQSQIAMRCHVVEKGLTMPQMRYGFGYELIKELIGLCNLYINKGYDIKQVQITHAVSALLEYLHVHSIADFKLDIHIVNSIKELQEKINILQPSSQLEFTDTSFFESITSSFDVFSKSRHSVRHYEGEVDVKQIEEAIEIANHTPSSCNRQPSRVYVIQDKNKIKQVLECQTGNRGFGHFSDKLIVLTADVSVYDRNTERNAVYIDGGMFGMNLLYSLHFKKIAACTLNAYFDKRNDKVVRKLLNIPNSEVFIYILSLGNVPKTFKVAISERNKPEDIYNVI